MFVPQEAVCAAGATTRRSKIVERKLGSAHFTSDPAFLLGLQPTPSADPTYCIAHLCHASADSIMTQIAYHKPLH